MSQDGWLRVSDLFLDQPSNTEGFMDAAIRLSRLQNARPNLQLVSLVRPRLVVPAVPCFSYPVLAATLNLKLTKKLVLVEDAYLNGTATYAQHHESLTLSVSC